MIERGADEPLRFNDAILWRDDSARAHSWCRHIIEEVELGVTEGVVYDGTIPLHRPARLGRQVEDRHMFGVGSGDPLSALSSPGP